MTIHPAIQPVNTTDISEYFETFISEGLESDESVNTDIDIAYAIKFLRTDLACAFMHPDVVRLTDDELKDLYLKALASQTKEK